MRILIAEDDVVSSLVLRKTLEKMGHEVTHAASGAAAWEELQREHYRLVISDWMMPEMDGLELCRRIRTMQSRLYVYVILLTAKDRREDRLEGLGAGADDFLTKPLDAPELIARLAVARRILNMQEELRERSHELQSLYRDLEATNGELSETSMYLQVANLRFQELFQGLPVACFTYDIDGRIREWNRAAEELYGFPPEQVFERRIWETVGQHVDKEPTMELVEQVFAGHTSRAIEWEDRGANGKSIYVQCSTFPLRNSDGEVVGAISANIDITDRVNLEKQVRQQLTASQELNLQLSSQRQALEKANAKLSELATTDGLTDLCNHRSFRDRLEQVYTQAKRHHLPLSLALLDVDRFKQFNDSFGHIHGDEVLKEVAHALREATRTEDVVARYGGEEFVVILPGTDEPGSLVIGERIRVAIESRPWPLRQVTASVGVSTMTRETPNASEIVDQADKALYLSKSDGRNRVTHYSQMAAHTEPANRAA